MVIFGSHCSDSDWFRALVQILQLNKKEKGFSQVFRSSRLQMFVKIGVLKNLANFTGKHLCWSLFLIKLQLFKSATLLKRDSNTGDFL